MTKKKVELNDKVELLVTKYMEDTGEDFNQIVNEALPQYIKRRMTPKEVRKALKNGNQDDSKFLDEYLQNHISNNWNI